MEILEQITQLEAPAKALLADIQAFEAPLPDYLMLGAFVILLLALYRSGRKGINRVQTDLAGAYQKELLTANRRAHQARSELRRAHLELERERQRKRRAMRDQGPSNRGATPRRLEPVERRPAQSAPTGTVPFKPTTQNRNKTRPVDPIPATTAASNENLFLNGVEK